MLPKYYHPHDKQWIKETMLSIPYGMRKRALKAYSELFESTERSSTDTISPEGCARFAANVRLRVFACRANEISNGAVKKPQKVK